MSKMFDRGPFARRTTKTGSTTSSSTTIKATRSHGVCPLGEVVWERKTKVKREYKNVVA